MYRNAWWIAVVAACTPVLEGPDVAVTGVSPELVCGDQLTTEVTVSGQGFAPLATDVFDTPALELPSLTLVLSTPFEGDTPGATAEVEETWASDTEMGFTVSPDLGLVPGLYDVIVTSLDGQIVPLPNALGVVGEPVISGVTPTETCSSTTEAVVTIEGTSFVQVGTTLPTVTVDGNAATVLSASGCTDIGVADALLCSSLEVSFAFTDAGSQTFTVTNPAPAACTASAPVTFEVLPSPTLTGASLEVACDPSSELTIEGAGFAAGSTVLVDGQAVDDAVVRDDATITATVTSLGLEAGDHTVTVTSPEGCLSEATTFTIPPTPTVLAALPGPSCEGGSPLTVTGADFAAGAVVVVDGMDAASTMVVDANTLLADVSSLALAPGFHVVEVRSAEGCSSDAVSFEVDEPPTLTSVAPTSSCDPGVPLTLTGTGFTAGAVATVDGSDVLTTVLDSTTLEADISSLALAPGSYDLAVRAADGCLTGTVAFTVDTPPVLLSASPSVTCDPNDPITMTGSGFEADDVVTVDGIDADGTTFVSGTTLTADVSSLSPGSYELAVRTAGGCVSDSVPLDIPPPITVTDVSPDAICDLPNTLTVTGTGFTLGSVVSIDGVQADSTSFVDSTTLTADFSVTGLAPGFHDVTVATPEGCSEAIVDVLEIQTGPRLFDVIPTVVQNLVPTIVTLYTSGITLPIVDVWLESIPGGVVTTLTYDATDPEQILVTIPPALAAGDYDLFLDDASVCPALLQASITVEDTPTISIGNVYPNHAWLEGRTWVTVTSSDPPPFGLVSFQDVPDVYLIPHVLAPVVPLTSVTFMSTAELLVLVPPGLVPALYDLLVVNPDGTTGIYDDAIEVTLDPPPTVFTVSPPSIPASGTQTFALTGLNFRTPSVALSCRDPSTDLVTTAAATVTSSDLFSIDVSVSTAATGVGSCVVEITNSDGTDLRWPGLAITAVGTPLFDWEAGPALNTDRRAAAAYVGRASATDRYLYAVGGDGGSVPTALSTIEVAKLDAFGGVGTWEVLDAELPEPRTLAGAARVGRFLYLVGGSDGTSPVDTVWRAQVLDRSVAPRPDGVMITYGTGAELEAGTWIYRVSALYDPGDTVNPGGESLPSDPIVVRVPNVDPTSVVTVIWTEAAGAVGYRIYRTPAANSGSGTEEWLADVAGAMTLSYTDYGTATSPTWLPLPLGALGQWSDLPGLPFSLQSPAVTVAPDPADPIAINYLYAAGGYDGIAVHDDVAVLDIYPFDEQTQDFGAWSLSAFTLPQPVTEGGAWSVENTGHPVIAFGETVVYFGGGRTSPSGGMVVDDVVFGSLLAAGEFDGLTATSDLPMPAAGFGVAAASNGVFAIGGTAGIASTDSARAGVLASGALGSWSALGVSLEAPRVLAGTAQEAAVVYVVGGDDGTGATTATDQSHL